MKIKALIAALALAAGSLWAQTAASVAPIGKAQYFDNNGKPCAGCHLYSYISGSSTPLPTVTDSTGTVYNQNPVILDSAGRAAVWVKSGYRYKFVLTTAAEVLIWTVDDVMGLTTAPFVASAPTTTTYTSGSGTYAVPTGASWLHVRICGAGGGAGGSGTGGGAAAPTEGGNSTFGSITANGGGQAGGTPQVVGGAGGTSSGGSINMTGGGGSSVLYASAVSSPGGTGGASMFGGGGRGGSGGYAGSSASAPCSGGGGGASSESVAGYAGAGGGAGGYAESWIATPAGSYSYSVGSGGTGGTAGTSGYAGGAGASGIIIVEAYNSTGVGGLYPGVFANGNDGLQMTSLVIKDPWVDVRAYGAKCDWNGTTGTDDSTAIQAAVTAVAGSQCVMLPKMCGISSQITWPSNKAICLVGNSSNTSGLVALSAMANMVFKDDGGVGTGITAEGTIRDIQLSGNQLAQHGLNIVSHKKLKLEDVYTTDTLSSCYEIGSDPAPASGNLVGLHTWNVNCNEKQVALSGVSNLPNYGVRLLANVGDTTWNGGEFAFAKIGGMYIKGSSITVTNFHPWGYGPSGAIPNSAPQYGIVVDGSNNTFMHNEIDTVTTAGFLLNNHHAILEGNIFTGTDAALAAVPVQIASGVQSSTVWNNTVVGTWSCSGGCHAVQWLGTIDTTKTLVGNNEYMVDWMFPSGLNFTSFSNRNGSDAAMTSPFGCGSTSAYECGIALYDRSTLAWTITKTSSGTFKVKDAINNLASFELFVNGAAFLNSGGTGAFKVNAYAGSGTGGFQACSGGASPTCPFQVDSAGNVGGRSGTFTNGLNAGSAGISHAGAITGISGGSSGKAMCWKTASTLGYCSTVVDSSGNCTCN
jgi:hypothetical protein